MTNLVLPPHTTTGASVAKWHRVADDRTACGLTIDALTWLKRDRADSDSLPVSRKCGRCFR